MSEPDLLNFESDSDESIGVCNPRNESVDEIIHYYYDRMLPENYQKILKSGKRFRIEKGKCVGIENAEQTDFNNNENIERVKYTHRRFVDHFIKNDRYVKILFDDDDYFESNAPGAANITGSSYGQCWRVLTDTSSERENLRFFTLQVPEFQLRNLKNNLHWVLLTMASHKIWKTDSN